MKDIDWQKVVDSMAEYGLSDMEDRQVRGIIFNAYEAFAEIDVGSVAVEGIEQKLTKEADGTPVYGYLDLVVRVGNRPKHPYWKGMAGMRVVIDWKTIRFPFKGWSDSYASSWQGKIYCWLSGAEAVIYRACLYDGTIRSIVSPAADPKSVEEHISRVGAMVRSLRESGQDKRWPRVLSYRACRAYGHPCPFLQICREQVPCPDFPDNHEWPPLSYSSMDRFLLCPERYRLTAIHSSLDPEFEDNTTSTRIGSAVHAGLACVWKQLFDIL